MFLPFRDDIVFPYKLFFVRTCLCLQILLVTRAGQRSSLMHTLQPFQPIPQHHPKTIFPKNKTRCLKFDPRKQKFGHTRNLQYFGTSVQTSQKCLKKICGR